MRYLVSYDIADDRRRVRMGKTLLNYGRRIQESVFWMELDENLYGEMADKIDGLMEEADCLHIVPVCERCAGGVVAKGRAYVPVDEDYSVI